MKHGSKTIVYQIRFPNGKRYIGITSNLETRKRAHKNQNKQLINKALKKYRNLEVWSIIAICQYRKHAEELEQYYIAKFNTTDRSKGYNVTSGGDGGVGLLETTKDRIAATQGRRPFVAFKLNGEYVGKWNNANRCERDLGLPYKASDQISRVLRGDMRQCFGYYFRHLDDRADLRKKKTRKNIPHTKEIRNKIAILGGGKPFDVFKDGIKIGSFVSQKICEEQLGVYQQNISKCLLGQRRQAGGYTFQYSQPT